MSLGAAIVGMVVLILIGPAFCLLGVVSVALGAMKDKRTRSKGGIICGCIAIVFGIPTGIPWTRPTVNGERDIFYLGLGSLCMGILGTILSLRRSPPLPAPSPPRGDRETGPRLD
jgi:hypothetical protein